MYHYCFEKWKWESFVQVANRISPGISRLRGVILYELQVDNDDQDDDDDDDHNDDHNVNHDDDNNDDHNDDHNDDNNDDHYDDRNDDIEVLISTVTM